MSDFTTTKVHRANKDHPRCAECGQPIARGSVYYRISQVFNGDFHSYKTHPHCREVADYIYQSEKSAYYTLEHESGYGRGLLADVIDHSGCPEFLSDILNYLAPFPDVQERVALTFKHWSKS